MKTYRGRLRGTQQFIDLVEKDSLHQTTSRLLAPHLEPSALGWGRHDAQARCTALVILRDVLGDDEARSMQLYHSFAARVIAHLPADKPWELTHDQVLQRVRQLEAERGRPILSAREIDAL